MLHLPKKRILLPLFLTLPGGLVRILDLRTYRCRISYLPVAGSSGRHRLEGSAEPKRHMSDPNIGGSLGGGGGRKRRSATDTKPPKSQSTLPGSVDLAHSAFARKLRNTLLDYWEMLRKKMVIKAFVFYPSAIAIADATVPSASLPNPVTPSHTLACDSSIPPNNDDDDDDKNVGKVPDRKTTPTRCLPPAHLRPNHRCPVARPLPPTKYRRGRRGAPAKTNPVTRPPSRHRMDGLTACWPVWSRSSRRKRTKYSRSPWRGGR